MKPRNAFITPVLENKKYLFKIKKKKLPDHLAEFRILQEGFPENSMLKCSLIKFIKIVDYHISYREVAMQLSKSQSELKKISMNFPASKVFL